MRGYSPRILIGIALPAALAGAVLVWAWKSRQLPAQGSAAPATPRASAGPAIPEALRPLTDTALPWQVRVDLLRRALGARAGEAEVAGLYGLLEKGAPEGELPEHWYVIANDIMEQLRLHDPDESRFAAKLLAFLNDTRQPPVLRDYAVQHLASWINPRGRNFRSAAGSRGLPAAAAGPAAAHDPAGHPRSREITDAVLTGVVAAAMNPELEGSTVPGTVCMMLVNLSRTPSGPDCRAAVAALKPWLQAALADGSKLDVPLRVSAAQVAALAHGEFRPLLRAIAYGERGEPSLRLSAIAALGRCGDGSDIERLGVIGATAPELAHAATDARRALGWRPGTARTPASPGPDGSAPREPSRPADGPRSPSR
jgi:hypothetical protein